MPSMKSLHTVILLICLCTCVRAQHTLRGQVQDADGEAIAFANVALYTAADSQLVKVETTDDSGLFQMEEVGARNYDLSVTYLGAQELRRNGLTVSGDVDLGVLRLTAGGVDLAETTVTADRALVEVKSDRTVFNVQGTINAVGNNGLELLRKAPGVAVDNNENISVLSRSGVLLYVDGRRMPLAGADLANYLRNLDAEQIDRMDIITNPGARYEAEGNAGIIDIRLKRPEDEGANGSLSVNGSQGRYFQGGVNANGNYRNEWVNVFGNVGHNRGDFYNDTGFDAYQNGLRLDEVIRSVYSGATYFLRLGADVRLGERHTLGVLAGGRFNDAGVRVSDVTDVYHLTGGTPRLDSTLRAATTRDMDRNQQTYNLNYQYRVAEGRSLNVDLDYGRFRNDQLTDQANQYFSTGGEALTGLFNYFDTPTDINIATAKADYEQDVWGGGLDAGVKFSRVRTYNTFLFYDVFPGTSPERRLSDRRSNQFDYSENVYAGYLSYTGSFSERWTFTAGLRAEVTDVTGELTAFRTDLREPPVERNYLSFFPSAGLTYAVNPTAGHMINLAYGRRINRPDYNVLNPFRQQISQLSYERGNPYLSPEIVNNLELGYTHAYRYNFKIAYSKTANQITRLTAPDEDDPRAGFITWDNLANQQIVSFSGSAPVQVTETWNLYANVSASYIDNQADYGDGATIDLQIFTYSFYAQNTVKLPGKLTAEISGYYGGPGVWGGVFKYGPLGAFNLGLQRKFLDDRINVKVSGNDLFFTSNWEGGSEFAGLTNTGYGRRDSRRAAVSVTYTFGNQQVKSRNRKTGIEEAAGRVGE
ncbi:TonB-dependent receptor domain-containing protein [Lewinella sp. IMCC34183]|uniref:TonB-dependent receptor domain-containing protein n=1 Tax=Lewinella sp. IMCC34183 TaxID=2248762 RepID=UPI000E2822D6|nr:TonB-dependent receptor [Lewinella sp. IMCC34183]